MKPVPDSPSPENRSAMAGGGFYHRGLIVGSLGLVLVAAVTMWLSDDLSVFARNEFMVWFSDSLSISGSLSQDVPPRMITSSFSSIALVAFAAIVLVDGFVPKKMPLLFASVVPLVIVSAQWPALIGYQEEWRAFATILFCILIVLASIAVCGMIGQAALGLRLVSAAATDESSAGAVSRRSIGLRELLMLTALSALVAAMAKNSYLSPDLFLGLAIWIALSGIATTARVYSLCDQASVRWQATAVSLAAFVGLRIYEEMITYQNAGTSAAVGFADASAWGMIVMAALVNAIIYWFMTTIPVLWMRANDWRVVTSFDRSPIRGVSRNPDPKSAPDPVPASDQDAA